MKVTYTLPVACRCPIDDAYDHYECTINSKQTIHVEAIIAAVKEVTKIASFQEDITAALAAKLGCVVVTEGLHSNVKTRVVCGDDE